MALIFVPLHCKDRLHVVNPRGTIGLVTLWSQPAYILKRLRRIDVDLGPETSPIAVVGTLYGNGLREMLRNLLYNPQIDTLLVFGRDRSGSLEELSCFFQRGLEPTDTPFVGYAPTEDGTIPESRRIIGTSRLIDNLVEPAHFKRAPRMAVMGSPDQPDAAPRLRAFFRDYRAHPDPPGERRKVPLPRVRMESFPSDPRAHVIRSDDPLSAWLELVRTLVRFGLPVQLAKGRRRELQNVKVVVASPQRRLPEATALRAFGYDPMRLETYRQEILSGTLHGDETYSYGNRIRAHFGLDSLRECVRRLRRDPEDRKSYVVLWDPRRDLAAEHGHPCLVGLFFRRFQDQLTLSATFRTHNALDAWLINFYGLMAIQEWVARRCSMKPGAVTVISHSITIDAGQLDRAKQIAREAGRQRAYREDPMGYFKITLDGGEILVEHRFQDVTLKEYRHRKAGRLQQEIHRDGAVSDINHAIYLGRQLARAEYCLRQGTSFIQE